MVILVALILCFVIYGAVKLGQLVKMILGILIVLAVIYYVAYAIIIIAPFALAGYLGYRFVLKKKKI